MTTPELLPCPFCGGEAEIVGRTATTIRCQEPQCISRIDVGPFNDWGHWAQAIAAWNRRAGQTANAERVAVLEAENARLREALQYQRDAIAEYYRYWTEGETRGSYDGKPERNALWSAMHKARAALEGHAS